ncbi:MAG: FAD-dependent thymidylate synthase, partial [Oscillospiraceae bacterium]|nr:FAD-dependent thymidylate synthase [Oscillospiraceae bacterium]
AAKLCYSRASIDELTEGLTAEKTANFVSMLAEIGHESPIEHASFTFAIEGVSRALLAQITRHRIGSYSVQSQRYVNKDGFEYILPPEIEAVPEAKQEFLEAMQYAEEKYEKLSAILKEKHKAEFMKNGKSEEESSRLAEKKAIEDARFVLPNACDTKMIVTLNARSLMNFFRLRCCNRAQWEIKNLADEMLKLVLGVAPNIFKNAGPACVCGACTEGKMSCGKITDVRQFYVDMKTAK